MVSRAATAQAKVGKPASYKNFVGQATPGKQKTEGGLRVARFRFTD